MKIQVGKMYKTKRHGEYYTEHQTSRPCFGFPAGSFIGIGVDHNGFNMYAEDGKCLAAKGEHRSSIHEGFDLVPNVVEKTGYIRYWPATGKVGERIHSSEVEAERRGIQSVSFVVAKVTWKEEE